MVTADRVASNVAHGGAVSGARLLLVDFLIGVGGVEPAGPLLLLALGERVLPQSWVNAILVKSVERCGCSGQLHVRPRSRSLQEQGEAVGVARAVTLGYNSGVNATQNIGLGWRADRLRSGVALVHRPPFVVPSLTKLSRVLIRASNSCSPRRLLCRGPKVEPAQPTVPIALGLWTERSSRIRLCSPPALHRAETFKHTR